jgi:hypothetical protein
MRSFWQAVEAGLHTVRLSNLADGMERDGLDALHAAVPGCPSPRA